ncbi:BlaI/MecI/CopY family transcriptional regulator [Psychroflexus planctonicus]|uniref:Transcriptional regulator n=1 Tax=Psychroflexus planctonicus TaxID=1526575 RepID=A0ABQ1SGX2_9FLAO|nr:BlaI/MecI/CopY family transcriptional regulator [Psychroflexus planctonicus]GGE39506.1 transcriptional regulator [Psychroflexus planctonicus]
MQLPKLTHKEEEIMHVIWTLEKAFVKEIVEELDEDIHYNTVSTMVRNLEDKQFVSHEAFGKTHRYFPLVEKEDYSKQVLNSTTRKFFDGSYKNLVSFFAKEENISTEDLKEIIEIIEKNK